MIHKDDKQKEIEMHFATLRLTYLEGFIPIMTWNYIRVWDVLCYQWKGSLLENCVNVT